MKSDEGSIRDKIRRSIEKFRFRHDELPAAIETRLNRIEMRLRRDASSETPPEQDRNDDWFLGGELSLEHELHNLANEVYKIGWFDDAIVFFSLALEAHPGMLETHFNRALAYTRVERYSEAIDDLTIVINLNENLAEAWYTRGLVYEYMREFDKAIEQYERALQVDEGYEKAATQREVAKSKKEQALRGQDGDEDERHERQRRERKEQAEDVIKALRTYSELASQMDTEKAAWRQAPERQKLVDFLSQYGRVLTTSATRNKELHGADEVIRSLVRTLSKRTRRSAIVVGPSGSGKSAVIQELAYRIVHGHPSIPARLRDIDIFEISPIYVQSDTKYRGEYEDKIKELIQVLEVSPKVVIHIDEIHSFVQSSSYDAESGYGRANEAFKKGLADGTITFIGCTTPAEYRHYIEPDTALARRFSMIRLEPPTREATFEILKARRKKVQKHYPTVTMSDHILQKVVEVTDQRLPGRFQPDKSIQLVDEACAYCITEDPPLTEVTEEVLVKALEDMTGRSIVNENELTESYVLEQLRKRVLGQDGVLQTLTRAVVSALGGWVRGTGPRGVFLFGGPTGVGKTETAVTLSEIIGGGRDALVRIDCNTIQGSGGDSATVVHRLLGVPRGLVGYTPGRGGALSRVRDIPDSVVLFDEFEKADPGVGKLLLQIIDEGRVEDTDGHVLDFRRSFIIFTSNAGSLYEPRKEISMRPLDADMEQPTADEEGLKQTLRDMGIGEEFFGRLTHVFLFQGLGRSVISAILHRRLEELRDMAELRNMAFTWSEDVVPYLTHQWQPRYGVRHLSTILRNRIVEQLNLADAQGELRGIAGICLRVMDPSEREQVTAQPASANRRKVDNRLEIILS